MNKTALFFITLILVVFFAGACKENKDEPLNQNPGDGEKDILQPVKSVNDYANLIKNLKPGDTLVIPVGTYEGNLKFACYGEPGKPIVIQGEEGKRRPVLREVGHKANLWEFSGKHIEIRHLEFESKHYAIRIGQSEDIIIEDCVFRQPSLLYI